MSDDLKKKKKKKSKDVALSKGLDLQPKKEKKSKKSMKDQSIDVSGSAEPTEVKKKVKVSNKTMITVEKDDFIIVRIGKKNKLCFAHSPKRNTAYVEDTMEMDEPVTVEYDADSLVANLGKQPSAGSAFGVSINPRHGEIDSPIGQIHDYRKINEAEAKALRIGIKKAVAKVEEIGLGKVYPFSRIEVHSPKGKATGTYNVSFKTGSPVDLVKFHPIILEDQIENQTYVLHETGLAIWFRYVPEKVRSEWLELYNSLTKVSKAKKADMEALFTSLVSSQMSVREFQRDLEEDEAALFKEALAYLKKIHKMSPEDVNILLNQNSKVLGEIWPTSAATSNTGSVTAVLGQVAATSVQKMFAEVFVAHLKGKQIPKSCTKLLEKTIKAAKAE